MPNVRGRGVICSIALIELANANVFLRLSVKSPTNSVNNVAVAGRKFTEAEMGTSDIAARSARAQSALSVAMRPTGAP